MPAALRCLSPDTWAVLLALVLAALVRFHLLKGVPRLRVLAIGRHRPARCPLHPRRHRTPCGISILLVFVEIAGSLTFMTLLGRGFKLSPKLVTLLAVGSSVCGVSATIATQGAIEADEQDSSFAIAAILALGAISLLFSRLSGTCFT